VLGWPRNDTDDHGMGFRVVLVLSAAVLVILIDARDGWRAGMARGGLTRRLEGHEGFWRSGGVLGWPRNDTDDHGNGDWSCSCSAKWCSLS
jgi:hypothetical protein